MAFESDDSESWHCETYVEAAFREEEELSPGSSVGQGGARVDKEKEEVVHSKNRAGRTVEDDPVPV